MVYAEASVLASLVMRDSNSLRATELTRKQTAPLLLNHLLKLEVCNAIRLKVASADLDEEMAAASIAKFGEMEKSGLWVAVEPDWGRAMLRSVGFSKAHSSALRTRTFDILHVAAALETGATEFWTFDKRQRALAEEVGLRIKDF